MLLGRVSIVLGFAGTLLAQHTYTPEDIEEGRRLFRTNCVGCHGPEGNLVDGVDLGHGKFRHATTEDGLIDIVLTGIPGTAMPPNGVTTFQAGAIIAYLRFIATEGRSVVRGDAVRGAAIFANKGSCTNCHRVNGNGSRVGPDLSEIGRLRRVTELERSILEPDAEVLPENRFYRVITNSGETITGRLLNEDTFSVQIIDSNEHLRSFRRSNLRESSFLEHSPMPSFREKLSPEELDDLVAYLVSLKGF